MSFRIHTIPFNMDRPSGLIILVATFRSSISERKIPVAFDTGATLSTIPENVALALDCSPSTEFTKRLEIVGTSGTKYAPTVVIPSVNFASFEFKDVEIACINLPQKSSVAGLLGLDLLHKLDILISFSKGELTFKG